MDRIDRVEGESSYSIYRCAHYKQVPYDSWLADFLPELNFRLQKVDGFLSWQKPLKKKINIKISAIHPNVFGVTDNEILLGKNLLFQKNFLEKAIYKIWLKENRPNLFNQHPLYVEALTDLMIYITKSYLPEMKLNHWSKATLSLYDYCQSEWQLAEHASFCKNKTQFLKSPVDKYLEIGLRPIISGALIDTYKSLPVSQKIKFFQNILDKPFSEGDNKNLQTVIYHFINRIPDSNILYQNLYKYGMDVNNLQIQLDYLIKTEEYLPPKSDKLEKLRQFAIQNPNLKIAVETDDRILVLPNFFPIAKDSFPPFKVHKAVMSRCGPPEVEKYLALSSYIEHLLYVDDCGDFTALVNTTQYMSNGIYNFATLTPKSYMVQFHLPSLVLMKEKIDMKEQNFYTFFNKNYQQISSHLGWANVERVEGSDLLKPIGAIDAIEWYRLPN